MEKEMKNNYVQAGKINKKVLDFSRSYVKEGKSLLDIAETLEKKIEEYSEGKAKPAWPVNLSINENAAHQTASLEEEVVLKGDELIKVDVGVHIDGYISDAAITLDLGSKNEKLVKTAEEALEDAINAFEKTRDLGEIGRVVGKGIKAKGFNPIRNLTGHFLEQWHNHAPPQIPNVEVDYQKIIEEDCVIAIEPFVTDGQGYVKEGNRAEIFAIEEIRQTRNTNARKILEFIDDNYSTLPFAERWITKGLEMADFQRKVAFRELLKNGFLRSYPILHEEKGKLVAQAETSLLIDGEEVIRLT